MPTNVHAPKGRRWIAVPAEVHREILARSVAEGRSLVSVIRRMLAETSR